jgi:hypothetical protein
MNRTKSKKIRRPSSGGAEVPWRLFVQKIVPLAQRPLALQRQRFRAVGAPRSPPAAVFDLRAHFCHSAPMETSAFRFKPRANAPEG